MGRLFGAVNGQLPSLNLGGVKQHSILTLPMLHATSYLTSSAVNRFLKCYCSTISDNSNLSTLIENWYQKDVPILRNQILLTP